MKRWFSAQPINRKLFLLCAVVAIVALLVSILSMIVYDMGVIRTDTAQRLQTLAEVVADNSKIAMSFSDTNAATETLRSLKLESSIQAAILTDMTGEPFANYYAPDQSEFMLSERKLQPHAVRFVGDHATLVTPVGDIDGVIGYLYVRYNTSELREHVLDKLLIGVGILLSTLVLSLIVAHRLQWYISTPIAILARATQSVKDTGNYSLRVPPQAPDEIGVLCESFNNMLAQIEYRDLQLTTAQAALEKRVEERTSELSAANLHLREEIEGHKRSQQRLHEMQQKLIDTARAAGMAEIATGTLHNVGNVLNSVNVSITLLIERTRKHTRAIEGITRATGILVEHTSELGPFFTEHAQGQHFTSYLGTLGESLGRDTQDIYDELRKTRALIDHIKEVVASQQEFAKVSGVKSELKLSDLFQEALTINDSSLVRHGIEVRHEFATDPVLLADKQRIMQVLVNLISNAKHAMSSPDASRRILTLGIRKSDSDTIQAYVRDTGNGIDRANLAKIFRHGFTTKQKGHGFGLHSSALAAKEMNGKLTVHSDGIGLGAEFTLSLPISDSPIA